MTAAVASCTLPFSSYFFFIPKEPFFPSVPRQDPVGGTEGFFLERQN
jgi:hypothetical protein